MGRLSFSSECSSEDDGAGPGPPAKRRLSPGPPAKRQRTDMPAGSPAKRQRTDMPAGQCGKKISLLTSSIHKGIYNLQCINAELSVLHYFQYSV